MTNQALTHDEAVEEVYRLTPQIRDYDEFMYMGVRWIPYTMFFQHPNYVSNAINTDNYGFRLTDVENNIFGVEKGSSERVNLIVGGSTVLGTGATADQHTLASNLTRIHGQPWINFSCRGYNATQELLLFLMHRQKIKDINNVVVFSGMNTLSLEGMPTEFESDHGRYYYSYEFEHYMQKYNVDLKRRVNSYGDDLGNKKKAFSSIRNWINNVIEDAENPTDKVIHDEDIPIEERVQRAIDTTIKSLEEWKILLQPYKAKLTFMLQPMASWTKDELHADEKAIFHAIDSCPNNFWRLFGHILGKEVHPLFANGLREACNKLDIDFHDMNELIATSDFIEDYVFVDRVHFNDHGHEKVSDLIYRQIA